MPNKVCQKYQNFIRDPYQLGPLPPQYKSESCFWWLFQRIFGTRVVKNVKIAQTEIWSKKFKVKVKNIWSKEFKVKVKIHLITLGV